MENKKKGIRSKKDNKLSASVHEFIKEHKRKEAEFQSFISSKKHIEVLDSILREGIAIDSDDIFDDTLLWTDDTDKLFSFIFDSCYCMIGEREEYVIKHNENFISFYEMHGQGTYRSIHPLKDYDGTYVDLKDINYYRETEKLPYKYEALSLVNRGIDTMEVALDGKSEVDFEKLREYTEKVFLH